MQKVFSIAQIREADRYTITNEPINSIDLMERAAEACYNWMMYNVEGIEDATIAVLCGMGNNGGDGLALARMFAQAGIGVEVYIVALSDKGSSDFEINKKRLSQVDGVEPKYIYSVSDFDLAPATTIVIDAILGSGLTRSIEGELEAIVKKINSFDALKIAIDMPSGLFADKSSVGNMVFRAHHTLTFQFPKLPFFFPENEQFVGEFHVLDIGLHRQYIAQTPTKMYYVADVETPSVLMHRPKFSHKGTYGHALLISGSFGKMGAAIFAAKGCMYMGCGLTTVHLPANTVNCMQVTFPEAVVSIDCDDNVFASLPSDMDRYTAAGVGPGLGTDEKSVMALKKFLVEWNKPLVLDADALNIVGMNKEEMLPLLPHYTIITPHVKEFKRWIGEWSDDFERLEKQKTLAKDYGIIVVLKGANTSICCPDGEVYFNSTGNPGMATGGSGDVLTGIITSLLAQGVNAKQAAIFGVYLHGMAGDIAASDVGMVSMTASDICDGIKKATKLLE
ncbi:MAG: NAD(P)H-hydrate dehydratase [Bacteroidales bacterium]|nr:NAD(P)H-hydrate dehydratase [Bacteroidales bacterium]